MTKAVLQQEISLFDYHYEQGNPLISDSEYEKKLSELKKLEAESGTSPDSPTQVIPFVKAEGLETVPHSTPILSMDKVTDFPALFRWYQEGAGVLIEPKLDGLTIVLRYSDGQLKDAITRGNGREGERVLHTVQTIKTLPKTIPYEGELEIRGEVYIPYKAFDEANNGEYANPRSMVAGTVRSLDPTEAAKRLDIQIFDLLNCDLPFDTAVQQYRFLSGLGFPVVAFDLFFDKNSIGKFIQKYEYETRANLPFPIDGVCIKYNELTLRERLGVTGKHPRFAMAYKFASLEEFTTLRDVVWQIGKSGQLTPVGVFDQICIDGVEITKATLHNYDFIVEKQIALNSRIVVARANDVIPKVVCAYPSDNDTISVTYPEVCPICGSPTEFAGPNLYCFNSDCKGQLVEQIIHFCSRDAMDIEGMGENAVKTFYDNGFIVHPADLYSLKDRSAKLKTLEGFGEKKITKILESIEESKTKPFERILYALNIPYLGRTNSRILADNYSSINGLSNASVEELAQLEGIGQKSASAIYEWFDNLSNQALINALLEAGVNMTATKLVKSNDLPLAGKVIVITGTLSVKRAEMEAFIRGKGGKTSDSVSKNTACLIIGPDKLGTVKHKKAVELGIPVLSEAEFRAKIPQGEGGRHV